VRPHAVALRGVRLDLENDVLIIGDVGHLQLRARTDLVEHCARGARPSGPQRQVEENSRSSTHAMTRPDIETMFRSRASRSRGPLPSKMRGDWTDNAVYQCRRPQRDDQTARLCASPNTISFAGEYSSDDGMAPADQATWRRDARDRTNGPGLRDDDQEASVKQRQQSVYSNIIRMDRQRWELYRQRPVNCAADHLRSRSLVVDVQSVIGTRYCSSICSGERARNG
jgi:hypothetical protein